MTCHHPRAFAAATFLLTLLFAAAMAMSGPASAQSYTYSWWSSDPEMTASITAPQYGASIPAGTLVSCKSSTYDEDTYYTNDYSAGTSTSTAVIDTLSYSWSASGGNFQGGTTSDEASWLAPTQTGTYYLTLTITDQGAMFAGDSGSRKDNYGNPVVITVQVQVVTPPPITWSATDANDLTLTKMACAGLTTPTANRRVALGESVSCSVATATDNDLRIDTTSGQRTVTHPSDTCDYIWGASSGNFSTQSGQDVTWTAPSTAGHYNLITSGSR